MKLQKPTDDDLFEAAVCGLWDRCSGAVPDDMVRPMFPERGGERPTAIYFAFENHNLHTIPKHLLTQRALASLWESPTYSPKLQGEFEARAEEGDWDFIEPILLTEQNALMPLNEAGETSLHIAARNGLLHTVPEQMLTLASMLSCDGAGNTPLGLVLHSESETIMEQLPITSEEALAKLKEHAPSLWLHLTRGQRPSESSAIEGL